MKACFICNLHPYNNIWSSGLHKSLSMNSKIVKNNEHVAFSDWFSVIFILLFQTCGALQYWHILLLGLMSIFVLVSCQDCIDRQYYAYKTLILNYCSVDISFYCDFLVSINATISAPFSHWRDLCLFKSTMLHFNASLKYKPYFYQVVFLNCLTLVS